jgi:hypothetical protein
MRNKIQGAALVLFLSLLIACTGPAEQTAPAGTTSQEDVPVVQNQIKALKKAKDLSRTLQQTEEARQRSIDAETR